MELQVKFLLVYSEYSDDHKTVKEAYDQGDVIDKTIKIMADHDLTASDIKIYPVAGEIKSVKITLE